MKSKQLYLMISALLISVSFFLPWVSIDPEFSTFAASSASYSGLTVIKGIGYGVQMINAFGTAYGFPFPASILYLGYLLLLMPLLGIAGVVLLGLRKNGGKLCIRVQAIMTLLFSIALGVAVVVVPDMKTLLGNMLNMSFGLILMNVSAIVALVFTFK